MTKEGAHERNERSDCSVCQIFA